MRLTGRPVGADEVILGLHVNGVACGVRRLRGSGSVKFTVPPGVGEHGVNELWLYVEGAPVAVQRLEMLDPHPAPAVEQMRRNEALRERRGE